MSENNVLPRSIADINFIRPILKQIKNGSDPHEIKAVREGQDVISIVEKLIEFGLVDHLALVAALQTQSGSGDYFLTDKGLRWLQTYDKWERFKHWVSKWQLFWGVVFGISINTVSSFIWQAVFA
ncbi:hypothetical protein [Pseudovibrio brasiliensis]|uniref:DUF2513 domain-containing protein n=1 Tax=Pseudovibrio brasiliensis TaxID=1898042 RepID=A0ABX8AJZ3_9HYPH|nr:hypothetical protein [Pseudovibrio brasiliensis]QUS54898.1 hypothetical protein KGB56_16200 [Pseudovibrio brasiliensis]